MLFDSQKYNQDDWLEYPVYQILDSKVRRYLWDVNFLQDSTIRLRSLHP